MSSTLWRPPSHSMCGFTTANMWLQGAPAKQNASSTSRPHSRRVFSAAVQTSLEPHAVMRHVQRGLFSRPNRLLISPIRETNSFMHIFAVLKVFSWVSLNPKSARLSRESSEKPITSPEKMTFSWSKTCWPSWSYSEAAASPACRALSISSLLVERNSLTLCDWRVFMSSSFLQK